MAEQSYERHTKRVPIFLALFGLLALTLIGSVANLFSSSDHLGLHDAVLIIALCLAVLVLMFVSRIFALKAQDRAIRAEEKLRHFILTGKPIDPRLTMQQIIGLRFAQDAEFPELARRAAEENLSLDAIKRAVKNWRADHDRL